MFSRIVVPRRLNSAPCTNATGKHLDHNLAGQRILPVERDELELAAFLGKGICLIGLRVGGRGHFFFDDVQELLYARENCRSHLLYRDLRIPAPAA